MAMIVKFNLKGFVALRNSPGVVADLERRAQAIAEAAGDGFAVKVKTNLAYPMGRAKATVFTDTIEAMIAEATDRALMSAIDAGR